MWQLILKWLSTSCSKRNADWILSFNCAPRYFVKSKFGYWHPLICSYEPTYKFLVDFDLFNRHNQWYSRGQHYTALRFPLLLMFIENCLVNNCLIMISAKANVFLSLLKFIDADWQKIFDVISCCNWPVTSKWSLCKITKVWNLTTSVTGPSWTKFLDAPLQLTCTEEVTYFAEVSNFVWYGFLVFSKRKPDAVVSKLPKFVAFTLEFTQELESKTLKCFGVEYIQPKQEWSRSQKFQTPYTTDTHTLHFWKFLEWYTNKRIKIALEITFSTTSHVLKIPAYLLLNNLPIIYETFDQMAWLKKNLVRI